MGVVGRRKFRGRLSGGEIKDSDRGCGDEESVDLPA